jgi:hypothetical protein
LVIDGVVIDKVISERGIIGSEGEEPSGTAFMTVSAGG